VQLPGTPVTIALPRSLGAPVAVAERTFLVGALEVDPVQVRVRLRPLAPGAQRAGEVVLGGLLVRATTTLGDDASDAWRAFAAHVTEGLSTTPSADLGPG
jgi:hypothetical protein